MQANAKSAKNALTRKVGPLPVYAYALAALGLFLYYRSRSSSSAGTIGLPATGSGSGSAAQRPASGQGNAADNASGDLLSALGENADAANALLAALQSGSGGGGMGATGGGSTGSVGGGSSTAASSAPTVVSVGEMPAFGSGNPFTGGAPGGTLTGDPEHNAFVTGQSDVDPFGVTPTDTSDALSRYLSNTTSVSTFSTASESPVSSPAPTVVQPAPVDTSSVIKQPTVGHNVAA